MNQIVSTRLIHLWLCLLAVTCFSFETEPARAQAPPKFWPGADWERVDKPIIERLDF